jgi:hypothetical protein
MANHKNMQKLCGGIPRAYACTHFALQAFRPSTAGAATKNKNRKNLQKIASFNPKVVTGNYAGRKVSY